MSSEKIYDENISRTDNLDVNQHVNLLCSENILLERSAVDQSYKLFSPNFSNKDNIFTNSTPTTLSGISENGSDKDNVQTIPITVYDGSEIIVNNDNTSDNKTRVKKSSLSESETRFSKNNDGISTPEKESIPLEQLPKRRSKLELSELPNKKHNPPAADYEEILNLIESKSEKEVPDKNVYPNSNKKHKSDQMLLVKQRKAMVSTELEKPKSAGAILHTEYGVTTQLRSNISEGSTLQHFFAEADANSSNELAKQIVRECILGCACTSENPIGKVDLIPTKAFSRNGSENLELENMSQQEKSSKACLTLSGNDTLKPSHCSILVGDGTSFNVLPQTNAAELKKGFHMKSRPDKQKVCIVENNLKCGERQITSVSSTVCRICHTNTPMERLLSPCYCKGSLAYVHLSCLERWLNQSSRSYCELCMYQYNAIETLRYGLFEGIRLWILHPRNRNHVRSDCLIAVLLTLITAGLIAVCVIGMEYFVVEGTKYGLSKMWTKCFLCSFLAIILVGYFVTIYLLAKDQFIPWYKWWKSTVNVHLILTPSVIQMT